MALTVEQIEKGRLKKYCSNTSNRELKKALHRRERQRVRANIECSPEYKKYNGWQL